MRYLTLNIADNLQLSIDNSMTGVETIFINDEEVSKKFSFWGATHTFTRKENDEEVDYKVKIGLSFTGIGYNIYRNDKPILMSNCVSKINNFSWFDVVVYLIVFSASAGLGYTLMKGILDDSYSLTNAIGPSVIFTLGGLYFYWKKKKTSEETQNQ